jgi:hypothetical protein
LKSPKFLVVQYAPGSAGKFLLSLLMSSDSVSHFDPTVSQNKTANSCVQYIRDHFTGNISDWIKFEPNHVNAWNLHFISTKYPRGDDLTMQDFERLAQSEASEHFWNEVDSNKIIAMPWHKCNIPGFFQDSKLVAVMIDKKAEKWFHRALWEKLYGCKNGMIHLKMNDPDFNLPMKEYFKKFNNPVYTDEKFYSFVKREILMNNSKAQFSLSNNFAASENRIFINLSDLLSLPGCTRAVHKICQSFGLAAIPDEIISAGWTHWFNCHNFKMHYDFH